MSMSDTKPRQTIERFIQSLNKKASSNEPDAGTSHPVGKADDNTQPAAEGARSAENKADVVADQGSPSVDKATELSASKGTGSTSSDQIQIGTKKAPTGEDPASETESVNSSAKDPGTSHPARVDNDELDGKKYAEMSLEQLAKFAADTANAILASEELAAAMSGQSSESSNKQAADDASSTAEAAQVGWDLAGLVAGDFDKQALDAALQARMEAIIKTASDDADNVIEYLTAYTSAKQAMAMPGGAPMGGAPMGGAPMGDAPMGDAPMGDAPMGGEGGQPSPEELMALLESLGITPEELMAAMAAQEGGGMGGEGEEPAAGPEDTASAPAGMEVEAAAKTAAAKSQPKQAADKRAEELKQAMSSYFKELVAKNRKSS